MLFEAPCKSRIKKEGKCLVMNEETIGPSSTWNKPDFPRGKCHNKTDSKTTVSLYLNKILVEKAKIHKLNLSRITEQALSSILGYLETQNHQTSSNFLSTGSFQKESVVPRAGFELAIGGDISNPRNPPFFSTHRIRKAQCALYRKTFIIIKTKPLVGIEELRFEGSGKCHRPDWKYAIDQTRLP
jgi:hypothetical protein